jgi:ribosome-associated protein
MKSKKGTGEKRQSEKTGAEKKKRPLDKAAARPGTRLRSTTGTPRIRATHSATADDASDKKPARPTRKPALRTAAKGARTESPRKPALTPASTRPRPERKKPSLPPQEFREASAAARELAVDIASAGLDKKALGVEVIDVSGRVDYADYLVIMTGSSDRHVHAISMGIEESLKRKRRLVPLSVEGRDTATWVLIDFDDVVVHVFQEDTRKLYDIEGLWMDAGRLAVPKDAPQPAS